ncbi:hypothetical protein A2U01_0003240 [Trifolium medium]|uniref:Uncharacterized protein n=1 Tax=Trifolium medium TaxID=97028 RepID=A0A392M8B7_9FABA|nr:hypothetical protein [Trifolium medium]
MPSTREATRLYNGGVLRSLQESTIIIVHARQNSQLTMGCSRRGEERPNDDPLPVSVRKSTPNTRIGHLNLSSTASKIPAIKRRPRFRRALVQRD